MEGVDCLRCVCCEQQTCSWPLVLCAGVGVGGKV